MSPVLRLVLIVTFAVLAACNPPPAEEVTVDIAQPKPKVAPLPNPLDPQLCEDTLPAKFAEYDRLRANGDHWKAAGLLRLCAKYGSAEIKKRVEEAEVASHDATINDSKASLKEKRQAMERLIVDYPALGKKYLGKIDSMESPEEKAERIKEAARRKKEGVRLGMSPESVLASSWGKPRRVNRTITAGQASEQWVYGGGNYLYFENGELVAIQN